MLDEIPEIHEKYEVLQKIGQGGMGAIYSVRHRLLDEIRVIKTIRPGFERGDHIQERFLREARVAAKLRHPHIASIYDFSMVGDGLAYIVMEYIDGVNLFDYYRAGSSLSVEEVGVCARQVLDALGYLHGRGFIHRDISTDNLMLTQDADGSASVKLIDLGLAKSLESTDFKTKTGVVMGKVRYVSPEQITRGSSDLSIDARSDLYSFGIVLYELLTGELPITGDDQVSLIAGHLYRPPKSFELTDPEERLPPALRSILLKTLEKDPEDRYASAAELGQALDRALSDAVGGPEPTVRLPAPPPPPANLPSGGAPPPERAPHDPTVMLRQRTPAPAPPAPSGGDVEGATRRRWKLGLALASTAALAVAIVAASVWVQGRLSDRGSVPGVTAPSGGPAASPPVTDIFFGSYHALVVGNNSYERLPQLESAVIDARSVAKALEERYGFEVTLLTDATREEMLNALHDLTVRLTERDNLLVYYAGHGDRQGQREYWQPVDAEERSTTNWISTEHEVSLALDKSAAKHILVVADSCYAGAGPGAPRALIDPPAPGDDPTARLRQLVSRPSRLVLTSGGLRPVLDSGAGRHSIFARAFLDALRESSGPTEVAQLFQRIAEEVPAAARRFDQEQNPTLAPIPRSGDEGGQFVFVTGS